MKDQYELLKAKCYNSEIEDYFPTELPLLRDFINSKITLKNFLDEVTVLFIQHHLSPFIGRLEAMRSSGLSSESSWFVDIPYSTNSDVKNYIQNEFTNHKYPEPYLDPIKNYSRFQLERVKSTILAILEHNPKKLLVVDDGAYFIRAIHEIYLENPELIEQLFNSVYLVEQTTRGHRYLQDLKYSAIINTLNIPIVSIARSTTKLKIESPFIGVACRKSIEKNKKIAECFANTKGNLKIGIIGYGSIGASVYKSVQRLAKHHVEVDIIEVDYSKWEEIKRLRGNPIPIPELRDEEKHRYDILFGCTGKKTFGWTDRHKVNKDALLVSVSSASIEFSRWDYIEFANISDQDSIEILPLDKGSGIHTDLVFKDDNVQFTFINSGFPVNFTGERECLPVAFIEPTHTLLYAASYQVLTQPSPGLHELNEEYDNWLYYNSYSYLKSK